MNRLRSFVRGGRSGRRPRLLAAVLLGALLATGCASLPDEGPVTTRGADAGSDPEEAPYFIPPGPGRNDSREEIVSGFLTAMQANPPSTAVARQYLSEVARDTWTPNQGTIVYAARSPFMVDGDVVSVRFSDANRLDSRGAWLGDQPGRASTLRFRLTQEEGQWRISNPPNVLAVPNSYFTSLFLPFELYFYDQTRQVLVPERIYVPSGEQTATNLVRALLIGPSAHLGEVTTTAFPSRTLLDLGVVVTGDGVVEVPLGPSILKLSPPELDRALAQLAQTLGQVPGVTRVRLTVNDAPVPLPGGRSDVSIEEGSQYDPSLRVGNPNPVAIRDGRVVSVTGDTTEPVGGPFGQRGFALRTIAADDKEQLYAAVSLDGRRVFVAPSQGADQAVRSVLNGSTDLQRPVFDMFGNLWVLDRTPSGARINVVERVGNGFRAREVDVPGVTGRSVSAITLTNEGTRLVAALGDRRNPAVRVNPIMRDGSGRTQRLLEPRTVQVTGTDLGPVRDVGMVDPTTLALLTRPPGSADRVVFVQIDGSPGGQGSSPPDVVPTRARALVTGPHPLMPLRVVTEDDELLRLGESGEWTRNESDDVLAAAYPR